MGKYNIVLSSYLVYNSIAKLLRHLMWYVLILYRLAELVNLEKLYISHNTFTSHTLPPAAYRLRQLKTLCIGYCGLTELDDRYVYPLVLILGNSKTQNIFTLYHNTRNLTQSALYITRELNIEVR